MDLVANWGPDQPLPVPAKHYHALCRFDYRVDLEKATAYRNAELPFVVYNHPGGEEVRRSRQTLVVSPALHAEPNRANPNRTAPSRS